MKYELDSLIFRCAEHSDLPVIVKLLSDDELGKNRESSSAIPEACYEKAFQKIRADSNNSLMILELYDHIIGICHLTLLPSLTHRGSTRLHIEAVRIAEAYREKGIGKWMFEQIFEFAKEHEASIIELTTDKQRTRARKFYEQLGFEATHEGMKKKI